MSMDARVDSATLRLVDTLGRVIRAAKSTSSARVCLLLTQDRDHALAVVQRACTETADLPLYHFTVAERRRLNISRGRWEQVGSGPSNDPAELLRRAQELNSGVVVLEDFAAFLRDEGGDRTARMVCAQMLSPDTRCGGLVLILLEPPAAEGRLPGMLAPQFVRLDIGFPRIPELERLVVEEVAAAAEMYRTSLPPEELRAQARRLAPSLVGLTRSTSRDLLRDGLSGKTASFEDLNRRLADAKKGHLSRELAMTVLETDQAEDPIGLDHLVEYLVTIRGHASIEGPERSRGVLLVGPPGTGKTMLARSLGGRVLQLPVVEFRVSSLMNSLLGETERRFAAAFATLEAMAPNVVFIDELEKAFGDSSERDGGTMMRCTGALLSWLSDNQSPNYIVATANDITRMGQIGMTMTRSERLDAAFFVDVPGRTARRAMLNRWLTGHLDDPASAADELSEITEKFSGADLRSLVKKAAARATHHRQALDVNALRVEADRKRPRVLALYDEFQPLRRWGRLHCEPAGPTDE